eukprot:g30139.t1
MAARSTKLTPPPLRRSNPEETNMSNALWPSAIYVKVIARVATQWSTEAMAAESAPARLFCSAAPIAPPTAPVLSHTARPSAGESRLSVQGSFDVTVELSLAGQAPDVVALHSGWQVQLVWKATNEVEEVIISDPNVRSYVFEALPPSTDLELAYGVRSLVGAGPWSPAAALHVGLAPLAPTVQVDASDDETISLSWTWQPTAGSLLNISSNLSQPLELAISAISELGEGPLSPWLSLAKLALPPLPPRPSIQSSSDTQIVVEWSLDRGKERGAYHTGYYVYVSVDGTTWPDEDTGYIATWQDEFTTQYTMDAWAA